MYSNFKYRSKHVGIVLFSLVAIFSSALGQERTGVETILQKGHSRYVSCLDYSPDGKYVATGSYDHNIILWNARNGKQIRTFSMHTDAVTALFFSPDGNKIVSTSADNKVLVYDIYTGQVLIELSSVDYTLSKARFSRDGSKIMTAADGNSVVLRDALSGKKLGTYKKEYSASIGKQWADSEGNRFLTYAGSKAMQLVNLADSLNSPFYFIERPFTYAISPADDYAAVASYKGTAKIFELKTGRELHELHPAINNPCDGCKQFLAFSRSGKYLVTATKYTDVVVWDVKKGTKAASFKKPEFWLDEVDFSPDGKHVVVTGDGKSLVWHIKTGQQILHLSYDGLNGLPVFSPDGNSLLTSNKNNTAALWSVATGKRKLLFQGYQNKERSDGLEFDPADWYHTNIIKHLEKKNAAVLSPDGRFIAKGGIDSVLVLLNIKTGKIERIFKGHSKSVITCAFSHDGNYLITGSGDHTVKLWDVASGQIVRTFKGHQGLIFDVKFSSDDTHLVSGGWDGSLRMWETATGKQLKYIRTENASPYCVRYTPNDLYVVSGDLNQELKLREVDSGKDFRTIIGHTDLVSDVCFSPDGTRMVTASLDGKVKVWDFLSGMLINKMSHASGVFSIAFHPQGKYIVSGSNDRTIKIWDALSGKEIRTLNGHSAGVSSLQISADGRTLVSCSVDGEIKVWNLDTFQELYSYIQIDRTNSLAKTTQGYFDGSASALKHINYVSGLDVIPVGSLFEKYYSPNLIHRIQEGEQFEPSNGVIHTLIKDAPDVEIKIAPDERDVHFASSDSIIAFNSPVSLAVQAKDENSGIDELRIYNNGKLVRKQNYANASKRSGKTQRETVDIPVSEGKNTITAVAFNRERTESQSTSLTVYSGGIESDVNLFILSIGINAYQNPSYRLNYAINDANAYSHLIRKNAKDIFKSVETYFIKDSEANKQGIRQAFETIAQKAKPEDVFLFYFAGHGVVVEEDIGHIPEFYIVPYDVSNLYGDNQMLKDKAISTDELLQLSMQVSARKQMFVLDACRSGGALTAFNTRGASREKAVAQLARSTGTFFLLAGDAVQYASEVRDLKHGIFTYALLEGLEGKADGGLHDNKITANELKSYVEDRVPGLTEKYMLPPQYPTGYSFGQDFPIVIVK